MNSMADLNGYSNTSVTFTNTDTYTLTWNGPTTGIGTQTISVNEDSDFLMPKPIAPTAIVNPVSDLTIAVDLSGATYAAGAGARLVNNTTAGANISVFNRKSVFYITGIQTINQYNEAFANIRVFLNADYANNFSYTTTISDRVGTSVTWNTAVTVAGSADYSIPSSVGFLEDVTANIANCAITDTATNKNYTVTFTSANPTVGQIQLGNSVGNSQTITGTKSTVNSTLSSNSFKFVPAADFAGTVNVIYRQVQTTNNIVQANNIPISFTGTGHAEFSIPASIGFNEDVTANIANCSITDQAVGKNYSVTIATTNAAQGQIQLGNSVANSQTITGNRAAVNSVLSANSVKFVPAADFGGNVNITYTQTQTTNNIVQANAVPITMVGVPHDEYIINPAIYYEDWTGNVNNVQIADLRANVNYNVTIAVGNATHGTLTYAGNTGNAVTLTGSKTTINNIITSNAIVYNSKNDFNGTPDLRYTQIQTTNNVIQANAVSMSSVVRAHDDFIRYPRGPLESGSRRAGVLITDRSGDQLEATFTAVTGNIVYGANTVSTLTLTGTASEIKTQVWSVRTTGTVNYTQKNLVTNQFQTGSIYQTAQLSGVLVNRNYPCCIYASPSGVSPYKTSISPPGANTILQMDLPGGPNIGYFWLRGTRLQGAVTINFGPGLIFGPNPWDEIYGGEQLHWYNFWFEATPTSTGVTVPYRYITNGVPGSSGAWQIQISNTAQSPSVIPAWEAGWTGGTTRN